MVFLVLEEISFLTVMLFNLVFVFFVSSLLGRMGFEREWGGSGVVSGVLLVSNWNYLGLICGVFISRLWCSRNG